MAIGPGEEKAMPLSQLCGAVSDFRAGRRKHSVCVETSTGAVRMQGKQRARSLRDWAWAWRRRELGLNPKSLEHWMSGREREAIIEPKKE